MSPSARPASVSPTKLNPMTAIFGVLLRMGIK